MNTDMDTQIILASVQLAVYSILFMLAVFKFVKAIRNNRDFLIKFYICVTILSILQLSLQIYQLVTLCREGQPSVYILMIINLYSMTMQAITIFILGDYWKQTSQIITKQSSEQQLKNKRNLVRVLLLLFWILIFSAFIGYSLATNSFNQQQNFRAVLALGCQGIAVIFGAWAVVLQILRGRNLAKAVGNYEQNFISISLHKGQFRLVYWISSIFNAVRLLFLIAVTLVFISEYAGEDWKWLAIYIYTFTNCIIISIYIFGFSTKPNRKSIYDPKKVSTLLEGSPSEEDKSSRSRHETQLSQSISDHAK